MADDPPGQARDRYRAFDAANARARAAAGEHIRDLLIAGRRIRLRFAGDALDPYLFPALSHQEAAFAGEPELLIDAWDSASTGVTLPDAVGPLEDHFRHGLPGTPALDGVHSSYQRPDPGLAMLDVEANRGIYWLADASRTPYEDRSGPFRAILGWWMLRRGLQFVHAAAVGRPDGGVLIAAKSGSGKSTTALTCLLAGLAYAGDDYCLLESTGVPYAHSLYSSAKLHGHNIDRLPELRKYVANPHRLDFEKGVFLLRDHFAASIVRGFPVRAVLVPRVTGLPATTVAPLPGAAALAALAPSTLLQLSAAREESMRMMAALVRAVPCYRLDLGTDVAGVPAAIDNLLECLSAGKAP